MSRVVDAVLRFRDEFTAPVTRAVNQFGNRMNQLGGHANQIKKAGREIQKVGKSIEKTGSSLTKTITAPIVGIGVAALKAGIDFESAFAGVKKTVTATPEQLATIRTGIIEMSKEMPMAANGIAAIAENAGQLGIETDSILEFSRVMADLSVATNLGAEEGAQALAKFANVTKMNQKDFDRLGSTIVALGNNFATTEADIVAMGTRLSGAGSQIGLTQGEIMGFSTALSSVGIEAEMGGSAFSKAMIKMKVATATGLTQVQEISSKTGMSLRELQLMADNDSMGFKELAGSLGMTKTELNNVVKSGVELEKFSKIAGMTTKEFKKLFETNPAKALDSFIKGLGDTEKAGKSTVEMLQEMGFTEVRLRDSLTRLANNSDGVSEAMEMGNKAWEENTALQNEANQRYETTASKLAMLKNKVTAVGIQIKDILEPAFKGIIDKLDSAVTWFSNLDTGTQKTILKFAGLAATIGPGLMIFGKVTSSVGGTILTFGKLVSAVTKGARAFNNLSSIGKIGGMFAKFGSIGKAAFMAISNPAGIAVIAIAAIAVGAFLIIKNWKKIQAFFKEFGANFKKVFSNMGGDSEKFTEIVGKIKETASRVVADLKVIFDRISKALAPVIAFIKDVFIAGIKVQFEAAKGFISGAVHSITKIIDGIITTIGGVTKFISGVFAGDWKKAWEGVKETFKGIFSTFAALAKAPINAVIGIINGAIKGINKIGFKIPDWVPGLGGQDFKINVPTIPFLYRGTENWKGGTAMIHDKGAEIVDLPQGSRVIPHDKSLRLAREEGAKSAKGNSVVINKLADQIIVRNDSDIDRIAEKIAKKLIRAMNNGAGEVYA